MSHRGPGGPAAKHRALPQRDRTTGRCGAMGREPGGPAAKHRALPQRDRTTGRGGAMRTSRPTATGPHHGARRRDGVRWRREAAGAWRDNKEALDFEGTDAAPCAAMGGARRRPQQNSQRVLLAKPRTAVAWRREQWCGGASRERASGLPSRAPRQSAAARWGHRALPQRNRTTGHEEGAARGRTMPSRAPRWRAATGDATRRRAAVGHGGKASRPAATGAYGKWIAQRDRAWGTGRILRA